MEYNKEGTIKTPLPLDASFQNIESMEVKGKAYNDVLRIYYEGDKGYGDWLQDGYFAKNIHLIRYRRNDSTTWNLVRYNIVK